MCVRLLSCLADECSLGGTTSLVRGELCRRLLLCTVENLKEGLDTSTHADVEVSLGALDVVVEVVTEGHEDISDGLTLGRGVVTALEEESDIAISLETRDAGELRGRILEIDIAGRSTLNHLADFSHKDTADNNIIRIIKADREDDSHTVVVLLEPDALAGTVVDLEHLGAGSTLLCTADIVVEDRCKDVTGETRHSACLLHSLLLLGLARDVNTDRDIVVGLGLGHEHGSVDLLEVGKTDLADLGPAGSCNAHNKLLGLRIVAGSADVPEDLVKVTDGDISDLGLGRHQGGTDNVKDNAVE